MTKKILALLFATLIVLAGCGTSEEKQEADPQKEEAQDNGGQAGQSQEELDYPQATTEVQENERLVEMVTSMGKIKIKLFPDQAPKAVENFIKHSEDGYYDGVTFHRVINGFMIQGGDPEGTGMGGESIYGKPFENEISKQLFNIRGALSMARTQEPDTNTSQFFIVQNKEVDPSLPEKMKKAGYPEKVIDMYKNGGTPQLDGQYTVFGQVIEGMGVVDKIAAVPTDEQDKPEKDVVIEKINVLK